MLWRRRKQTQPEQVACHVGTPGCRKSKPTFTADQPSAGLHIGPDTIRSKSGFANEWKQMETRWFDLGPLSVPGLSPPSSPDYSGFIHLLAHQAALCCCACCAACCCCGSDWIFWLSFSHLHAAVASPRFHPPPPRSCFKSKSTGRTRNMSFRDESSGIGVHPRVSSCAQLPAVGVCEQTRLSSRPCITCLCLSSTFQMQHVCVSPSLWLRCSSCDRMQFVA